MLFRIQKSHNNNVALIYCESEFDEFRFQLVKCMIKRDKNLQF